MMWPTDSFRGIFVASRKWLCLVLIAVTFSSCRSSRNLDSHVNAITQEEMQHLMQRMDSLMANVHLLRSESSERFSKLKFENRTVYYSVPDSTGRQYPTAVSETKSESSEQESSRSDTELYATVTMLSVKVDSLSARLDAVLSKQEKIVELSWWDKHKEKVYIGFALIIVGWLVYKSRKK